MIDDSDNDSDNDNDNDNDNIDLIDNINKNLEGGKKHKKVESLGDIKIKTKKMSVLN